MRIVWAILLAAACAAAALNQNAPSPDGKARFKVNCASCHGGDANGGEHGPSLVESDKVRSMPADEFKALLKKGIPGAGMPAFPLADAELDAIVGYVRFLAAPAISVNVPGNAEHGREIFERSGCLSCHMMHGRGGLTAPDLSNLARERRVMQIETALRDPNARRVEGYAAGTVTLRNGRSLRGLIRNESNYDIQVQSFDGELHSFPRDQIARIERDASSLMPPVKAPDDDLRDLVAFLSRAERKETQPAAASAERGGIPFSRIADPRPGDWLTYHGNLGGNRYSPLDQINTGNVARLAPRWMVPVGFGGRLEVTPVVADGVMYVTNGNSAVFALDARSGRQIWRYTHPAPKKHVAGDAGGGINRGVAILGNRIFLVTRDAHMLALDRRTGSLLWDVEMADANVNYGATSAPLVVKNLVVSGTSGGDEGVRGFLAAYKPETGERVWGFWTVPDPGDPAYGTWEGKAIEHGCVATWMSGSYDARTDTIYWPTGNPCPDFNGDERKGDNLYSDSVLALKPETGELKWHFQFTPHDVHDWDSAETMMAVDAEFQGAQRRLLLHADRNGFFYVLDRETGKLLLARPFVQKLTWASGIGAGGRPQVLPNTDPTPDGVKVCPALEGATNWFSSAFSPATGLFYLQALEKCTIYTKSQAVWEAGKSFYGGEPRDVPGEPGRKYLRAIDISTGKIKWEYPQIGYAVTWGGVMATAGGLVFFGDDSGAFAAVDAESGKPLWHFHTNELWKASPMTYAVDGKQYIAVAVGSTIMAFALPD